MSNTCDAAVIGGGFYGLYLAEALAARVNRVILFESGAELMLRASYSNQARVHNGYHYPRSILTALRSRVNFPRFVDEFRPAIDSTFEKIYAIGRRDSKVSAEQFCRSMRVIGASVEPVSKSIWKLFDPAYIEAAFLTREYAFNALILRELMAERVHRAGVEIQLKSTVKSVHQVSGDVVELCIESPSGTETVTAAQVFCCGYSQLNSPGMGGGLPLVPLKHELVEMALVEVPEQLRGLGVTVMDGPFFSLMPFPARQLHTLSHVRYTPHAHWYDGNDKQFQPAYGIFDRAEKKTAFPHMIRDAARYLPLVADCTYCDSLWEVKTILPRSEADDSRPILFRPHFGLKNYHLVMGGKIDNIYDISEEIDRVIK